MTDKKIIDLTAITVQSATDLSETSLNGTASTKETRLQKDTYTKNFISAKQVATLTTTSTITATQIVNGEIILNPINQVQTFTLPTQALLYAAMGSPPIYSSVSCQIANISNFIATFANSDFDITGLTSLIISAHSTFELNFIVTGLFPSLQMSVVGGFGSPSLPENNPNLVFVSPAVYTGIPDGSYYFPYATVADAMDAITSSTISNPFCIILSGDVIETRSVSLKPFVEITGLGISASTWTVPNPQVVDATFCDIMDCLVSVSNLTLNCYLFRFSKGPFADFNQTGIKLYLSNVSLRGTTVTFKGNSSTSFIINNGCTIDSGSTINAKNSAFSSISDCLIYGVMNFTSESAGFTNTCYAENCNGASSGQITAYTFDADNINLSVYNCNNFSSQTAQNNFPTTGVVTVNLFNSVFSTLIINNQTATDSKIVINNDISSYPSAVSNIGFGGFVRNISAIFPATESAYTTTTTISATDMINKTIVCGGAGGITLTLPLGTDFNAAFATSPPVNTALEGITITNGSVGTVTIANNTGFTIGGMPNPIILAGDTRYCKVRKSTSAPAFIIYG